MSVAVQLRTAPAALPIVDERLAQRHAVPGREAQVLDDARVRRGDRQLHLHRLEHEQDVPLGDRVALRDVDEQHRAGHRRLQRLARPGLLGPRAHLGPRLQRMPVAADPDASPSAATS